MKKRKPEFISEAHIEEVFDVSSEYFIQRKEKTFFMYVHYFPLPNKENKLAKTKKVVLWDIDFIRDWIRNNYKYLSSQASHAPQIVYGETDPELVKLLERS